MFTARKDLSKINIMMELFYPDVLSAVMVTWLFGTAALTGMRVYKVYQYSEKKLGFPFFFSISFFLLKKVAGSVKCADPGQTTAL